MLDCAHVVVACVYIAVTCDTCTRFDTRVKSGTCVLYTLYSSHAQCAVCNLVRSVVGHRHVLAGRGAWENGFKLSRCMCACLPSAHGCVSTHSSQTLSIPLHLRDS